MVNNSCDSYKYFIRNTIENNKEYYLTLIAADSDFKERNWKFVKEKFYEKILNKRLAS